MDAISSFLQDNVGLLLPLILGGALGPAALTLIIQILRAPVIRDIVGGVCYGGGIWFSACLSRVLNRFAGEGSGRKAEDALQDFFENVVLKKFYEGLDKDDAKKNEQ